MATIQDRAFSRNYSGLRNQLAVAGVLVAICLTGYELMRRKRRGERGQKAENSSEEGIGSVETWEFGYLYQGRCWAKNPSPPLPTWPLAWVKQALQIPESSLADLLGIDATLYIRFLKGCRWFIILHTCTTFPVLFSLHLVFSPSSIPLRSMDKASISSLVQSNHGTRLLFVHVIIAYYITITWVLNLLWIARGAFRYRAQAIESAAAHIASQNTSESEKSDFHNRSLRLRTIMVTNVPVPLRSEKAIKDYFEYWMSRPLGTPPIRPGFIPKMMTFLFNRAAASTSRHFKTHGDEHLTESSEQPSDKQPAAIVERVVVARKTTELASLLERRQDVLKRLEHAHVRLARYALQAARGHLDDPSAPAETKGLLSRIISRRSWIGHGGHNDEEATADGELDHVAQLNLVTETLTPFISEFHVPSPKPIRRNISRFRHYYASAGSSSPTDCYPPSTPVTVNHEPSHDTVWEALYSLPRTCLDAYQPLINLSRLFRGRTVPAIDYYAAKLGLLTALINENRGRSPEAYPPSSTAFVTFEKIEDARRAAKYLQVHPRNPLACLVVPAPDVADLDWVRVMKSSFTGEFLKDWVVNIGVWAFICSWVIPISLLVGLVNIQNLGIFIPGLQAYLRKHPRDQEAISSLLPTILVSILTILVPMILLLIAKKAHTIITFSKLHDTIMIRYWKFLVCNLLVFFCVGVSALESFLQSFRNSVNPLPLIASSFPTAGPFYVGNQLFYRLRSMGFLSWVYLPLILYPATRASTTLRRRAAGIRPRTFNFYYWLPNHVLVMTIVICFALLNPLVIPFALVYFSVESVIVKHQLVHVYAKQYDNNGKLILVRIVRYSLDGLSLAHVVFLAFLVVLRQTPQAAVTGVLVGLTVITKIILTQLCRGKFAEADHAEDHIYSGGEYEFAPPDIVQEKSGADDTRTGAPRTHSHTNTLGSLLPYGSSRFWTWKLPPGVHFSYASHPVRSHATRRGANPFGPSSSFTRLTSAEPERPPQIMIPQDMNVGPQKDIRSLADVHQPESILGAPFQETPTLGRNNTNATRRSAKRPIVTPHPKHETWDDFPHLNRPYENPYYVAPVDKFLWLPRNPFGVLDLDDSVDLHQALTSEPGMGELDRWLNESGEVHLTGAQPFVETPSAILSPESEENDQPERDGFPFKPSYTFNGTEEISMSPVLAARVGRIRRESDVDNANPRRSSFRTSSFGYGRRPSDVRRPSSASTRNRSMFVSTGQTPVSAPVRSSSGPSGYLERQSVPSQHRSPSRPRDPVNEPDVQAQAVFMESSLSVPLSTRTGQGSRLTQAREQSTLSHIPVREAVVGEIIAEEQAEVMERVRREQEEQRVKEAQKPSWWNSWLWTKSHLMWDKAHDTKE